MDSERRVTRSMERQNSNTIENMTKNFRSVSTEERDEVKVTVSPPRKHKLSTSKEPQQKKKPRQLSDSSWVTKELMKKAIQKLLEEKTEKTPQRKHSRRRSKKTSPLACNFSEQRHTAPQNASVKRDGPPSLEFSSDIEADGAGPSTIRGEDTDGDTDTTEHAGSIDPKVVEEVAAKLRKIGDAENRRVTEAVTKAAVDIVKKKAYKKYRETVEVILKDNQWKVNDASERYAVALILLLTEKVVDKAKEATIPASTLDEMIEISAEFIHENYPAVINL